MPLVVYSLLLLLSCGIRLLVVNEGAPAPAALDRAAAALAGHAVAVPSPVRAILGVAVGAVLGVAASRLLARWSRYDAMRNLSAALAEGLSTSKPWMLAALAVLGGVAEEVFFRGVLQPWLGIGLSALAFGAVHVRLRRAAWPWPVLAVAFGLVASLALEATGTLLTPVVMHVLVNLDSQRRLGRLAHARERRALGGLLRT